MYSEFLKRFKEALLFYIDFGYIFYWFLPRHQAWKSNINQVFSGFLSWKTKLLSSEFWWYFKVIKLEEFLHTNQKVDYSDQDFLWTNKIAGSKNIFGLTENNCNFVRRQQQQDLSFLAWLEKISCNFTPFSQKKSKNKDRKTFFELLSWIPPSR